MRCSRGRCVPARPPGPVRPQELADSARSVEVPSAERSAELSGVTLAAVVRLRDALRDRVALAGPVSPKTRQIEVREVARAHRR